MKKILITGSSGLIGSVIIKNLSNKYVFSGMDRNPNENYPELKTLITNSNDLNSILPAFKNIDTVIHLAANVSEATEWELVLNNNIILTKNIYEASKINNIKRVIFASSNHAVGNFEKDFPYKSIVKGKYDEVDINNIIKVDSSVPIRPDSDYGISKAFGEAVARYYFEHHGIESACLRIGTVRPDNSPKTDVRHFATMLYHEDLAQLIDKCIEKENLNFEIFYGVSNNKWRFWDLEHARKTIGYDPKKNAENER